MTRTISGVVFSVASLPSGEYLVSVVQKSDSCTAVEFIAEANDGAWASEVTALRQGTSIRAPSLRNTSSLTIRLFNDIGREINRGSDNRLELGERVDVTKTADSQSSGGGLLGLIVVATLIVGGYHLFNLGRSRVVSGSESRATLPEPSIAILARAANLRMTPRLNENNIISTLPFGTQLIQLRVAGDFFEVQVFGGTKGFVHRDVVGDAGRVRLLGLADASEQARSVQDTRRAAILDAARQAQQSIARITLLLPDEWPKYEPLFVAARGKTSGEDVDSRFFRYLAEEASKLGNPKSAVTYFRAAALLNPLSAKEVHSWGVEQIKLNGTVDETAALHAVVVAPRATYTWLMVAAYLSTSPTRPEIADVTRALRLALGLSSNPSDTKREFKALSYKLTNDLLKAAIVEVVSTM